MAEVVEFHVSGQGAVPCIVAGRRALYRSNATCDGLNFSVLHLLSRHTPSVVVLNISFVPSDAWAVVPVIAPLATVGVATFSRFLVFVEVYFKIPQWNVIVMHVVVKVNEARVDGSVGFDDWNIGQVNAAWDCSSIRPYAADHAISDHDIALVENVVFSIHGDNASLQEVSIVRHWVWDVVALDDVQCHV